MTTADLMVKEERDTVFSWDRILPRLREEFGETAFANWFVPIRHTGVRSGTLQLTVPTRFMRDWIMTHYGDRIRALCSVEDPSIRQVNLSVNAAAPAQPKSQPVAQAPLPPTPPVQMRRSPSTSSVRDSRSKGSQQGDLLASVAPPVAMPSVIAPAPALPDDLSAPLDPRYTFESFVTGATNEFACAAARRIVDSSQAVFNPLFLYGGVGLGKTHLMHAIAHAIRSRHPERRVIYLSAEKFMYSFVRALRYKDTMAFKEQFRSVDVLMIDDVQFISGKDTTQEEFFHTFNALVDQGRQVVISADKSPADLDDIGDRLRSRLSSGLVADIHPTTYDLRLGILSTKAETSGVVVPPKVLEFLAHKISSNIRELEGALTRLIAHAQLVGRALSLETAQDVLRDLLRANDRRVTIDEIQKRVAEHFQLRVSDMHSARRSRSIARPRQIAMFLSKQLTSRSLPEIGRKFGGRDHTTVIHAVKKINQLMSSDTAFAEDVELLRRMLET